MEFLKGDLFKSGADALVNPVNCDGVMGKGLAKEFKLRWPEMYRTYQGWCGSAELRPGGVLIYKHSVPNIVLFATKANWRNPSRYEYIEEGLLQLKKELPTWLISSLAMPAIGCGLGGLEWPKVKELIEKHLAGVSQKILVYEP